MKNIKKEICPFCDNEMEISKIQDSDFKEKLITYVCECGWEHVTLAKI